MGTYACLDIHAKKIQQEFKWGLMPALVFTPKKTQQEFKWGLMLALVFTPKEKTRI